MRATLKRALLSAALAVLALAALSASQPKAASAARIEGVDVSRFNGKVDWDRVAGSGIRFAFIAAGRGSGGDCSVKAGQCGGDPLFERNRRRARAAGIRVGAYHRAFVNGGTSPERARADALAEARVFLAQVGDLRGGELLPALDLETPFGRLDPARLRLWARVWLHKVGGHLSVRPLIYTNGTSWAATGDTTDFARAGHRLWVANWGVSAPAVPAGGWAGRGWSVWQFTSSGHVAGISGRVDMNRLGARLSSISVPKRGSRTSAKVDR